MFEEEAEEYKQNNIYNSKETGNICIKSIEEAFQDGATLGYNKNKAIADLKKENEELWTHSAHLTALVEKMKCCANCENYCQRIDNRCNTECKNRSLWKLNEDFGWRTESN